MTTELQRIRIAPLTKQGKNGEVYHRREEVEQQLAEIARMDFRTEDVRILERRIRVRLERETDSLKSETLVALFRVVRDDLLCKPVWEAINSRFFQILNRYRYKFPSPDLFDEFADEVWHVFLKFLLDESDKGDYAQVSFGDFVGALASNAFRKWVTRLGIEERTIRIDHPLHDDDDLPNYVIRAKDITPEERLIIESQLLLIPQPQRDVWILHRIHGWKIQSNDPLEPTLETAFRKTERTIRNWIKKADEILAEGGGL